MSVFAVTQTLQTNLPSLQIIRFGGATVAELRASIQLDEQGLEQFERRHGMRIAFLARDQKSLASLRQLALDALGQGEMPSPKHCRKLRRKGVYFGTPTQGGVVFHFPGQGAQYPNMLSELTQECPFARQAIESANRTLSALGLASYEHCVEASTVSSGRDILATQTALLVAQFAIIQSLHGYGVRPSIVAGHSFGEYAALLAAGAWGLADALLCSTRRASVMVNAKVEGTLAVVAADAKTVERWIAASKFQIFLANLNATSPTVVGGKNDQIAGFLQELTAMKVSAFQLQIGMPFHTPLMKPARIAMEPFAETTPLTESHIPVVLTSNAKLTRKAKDFRRSLAEQLDSPIDIVSIGAKVTATQPRLIVDVGPSQTLTKFLLRAKHCEPELLVAADDSQKRGLASILQVAALASVSCYEENRQGDHHANHSLHPDLTHQNTIPLPQDAIV